MKDIIFSAYFLLIMICQLFLCQTLKNECPQMDLFPSCTCSKVPLHGLKFMCKDYLNIASMKAELRELDGKYNIYYLEMWNCVLNYLPTSLFRWVQMKQLKILNSTIMGIEDEITNVHEENLERLVLENTKGVDSWRWSTLSTLQHLWSLEIRNSDLSLVNENFNVISTSKLVLIDLSNNVIDFIEDNSFSTFDKIYSITLNNNKISKISRSMFANPSKFLKMLDVSNNKLQIIPDDMFMNMPVLKEVLLDNNNIKILDQKTFLPLMKRSIHVSLKGNDIYCCSYLSWMIINKSEIKFSGKCSKPGHLNGKQIQDLTISEFDNADC